MYFSTPWGRDFESGSNLYGNEVAQGYSTAEYPLICMVRGARGRGVLRVRCFDPRFGADEPCDCVECFIFARRCGVATVLAVIKCGRARWYVQSYRLPAATIASMLIRLDSPCNSNNGWRPLSLLDGCSSFYGPVATWAPLQRDNVWHRKCIDLNAQVQVRSRMSCQPIRCPPTPAPAAAAAAARVGSKASVARAILAGALTAWLARRRRVG